MRIRPFLLPTTCGMLIALIANGASGQRIQFTRSRSGISERSAHRIERFLTHVFPTRQMRHYNHFADNRAAQSALISRSVTWEMISQNGIRFVLAGFTAWWNQPVHEIAVYRMEDAGPNQVWRSLAWCGTSGDLHFSTAKANERNIVLFQEGGNNGSFSLASLFTFRNEPQGLYIRDLTPELPWLRARERFPLRSLYGQRIHLSEVPNRSTPEKRDIILHATDEEYNLSMAHRVRPSRAWKYNALKDRFELASESPRQPREAQNK